MLQIPQMAPVSQNRLLAALPPQELERLAPHFQLVSLVYRKTLFEAGVPVEYFYFPLKGCISTLAVMKDGTATEVGIVGKEGATDVSVALGDHISNYRGVVQLPGSAVKLSTSILQEELRRDGGLRSTLLRYTRFTLAQATQSAACNRLHSLEQRCARWLLGMRDRVEADTFPMTHEFLAYMLGVQRPGVTVAAQALQRAGRVRYARGRLDDSSTATGLKPHPANATACSRGELARLLG